MRTFYVLTLECGHTVTLESEAPDAVRALKSISCERCNQRREVLRFTPTRVGSTISKLLEKKDLVDKEGK